MKPTIGRIVIVKFKGEPREMPGIIVEIAPDREDGIDNTRYVKIKVFHPDGDEFDPMWIWYSENGELTFDTWRWPPREGA